MRAVRVVAAAAAVCVAALSACTASQQSPASVPAGVSLPLPGGMPRYYVVVARREIVVRASGDGHVTGSVAIPVPAGNARSSVGGEPFASTDDRHFVIVVSRGGDLPGVADVTLFLLTVSPGGRPGKLRQLTFDSRGVPVIGAALSPDGKTLALSLVQEFPPGPLYGSVEVINVTSGTTRTWTGRGAPGYWPGVPSWAGDGTVVVPWWHDTGHGMISAAITGVRQLDLAAPGGSLAAAGLITFPAPWRAWVRADHTGRRRHHHVVLPRRAPHRDRPDRRAFRHGRAAGPGAADADGPVRQRRRRPGRDLLDVPGAVGGLRR